MACTSAQIRTRPLACPEEAEDASVEARWEWGDISLENVADCEGEKREGWVVGGVRLSILSNRNTLRV